MNKSIRKRVSWLLAAFMIISLLPAMGLTTFAAGLEELTVSLSARSDRVILKQQGIEAGYDFYFKTTNSDDSGNKPAFESTDLTGWTAYSDSKDIPGTNGTIMFVQVIKVDTTGTKIVGWGQASATPATKTGGTSSGLTDVSSLTIYNLKSRVTTTTPGAFTELVVQKNPSGSGLQIGYQQQSTDLVTIRLGGILATPNTSYLTPNAGDVFFGIGGVYASGPDFLTQTPAFYTLFDSCGGTLAFNDDELIGHRYGCGGGGVVDTPVYLYEFAVYEMTGIQVELKQDVRYEIGNTVQKSDIEKVIGTYVNRNNDNDSITAELDSSIYEVTFLHADGTTSDVYAGSTDKIRVTVIDQNLGTTFIVDVAISYTKPGGGGGGGGSNTQKDDAVIVVDGKDQNIGKVEVDKNNDTTTVVVDHGKLEGLLESAKNDMSITIPTGTGTAAAELVVKDVDDMASKDMTLTVKTGDVGVSLPADSIDTAAIVKALGNADPSDITFKTIIKTDADEKTTAKAKSAVDAIGGEIIIPTIDVSMVAEHNGKTYTIETLDGFATHTIALTSDQARRITTAIVVEADGSVRHLPTYVFASGGKDYADVYCMTNCAYVLIYNEQSFSDVKGKWYEQVATEGASRKIISGVTDTTFAGDRAITRAEFAAIVVRSLGLPSNGNSSAFTDVSSRAWYSGAVGTAQEYGLVMGRTKTSFDPEANITRQEAMAIMHRTATIIGYDGTKGNIDAFSDANKVSNWAKDSVQFCVGSKIIVGHNNLLKPVDNITRAETVQVVLDLLRSSKLVDDRS